MSVTISRLPPLSAEPSQKREEGKNQLKEMFLANTSLSIRKASANTGISYGMVQSILKEDLHLKPYEIHQCHQLRAAYYQKRVDFADFFMGLPNNARSLLICCDEAYFYLTRQVNVQNDRLWLYSKPTDKIGTPLHDQKVLVWCAISRGQTYRLYFSKSRSIRAIFQYS